MKTIQEFKPVCAVICDEEDPGAEFEDREEAGQFCREMEQRYGRSGEDREFPMIVDYQRDRFNTEY